MRPAFCKAPKYVVIASATVFRSPRISDGAASARAEYALATLSKLPLALLAAIAELNLLPRSARSLQFFAEVNDGLEPLDDEDDEDDDEEDEDDEDDDDDEL